MESDSSENVKNNSDSLFCFVDGCFTTSSRNKNLGFHQFPPNDEKRFLRKYKNGTQKLVNTRQLWIEALNIEKEGTTVIGKMRVCSLHFSKNDYYIKDAKKPFANLKRTAIPRRNLPLRKNSKLTTRLQVRGFNRLKWRGRLSFQDLDVRVPISRNRPIKKTEQKEVTKKTPQNVVVVEEEVEPVKIDDDEEECIQVEGFSLASLEDGMEKTIVLDGESVSTEKEQITSEFIIKEEPLSDNEQEMEEWNDENIIVEQNVNDNQETVWMTPQTAIDNQQAITTESVLEDLESSGDEAGLSRKKNEENKKEREDEKEKEGDEEEETSLRDRPCKQCGSRDCRGHDERLSPATFVCMVCNELFHTSAQLDAHSEKHDEELNMYGNSWHDDFVYRNSKDLECKICGKHFATKTVLKEHVSRHVGDKLLVCLLCGRQFRHKINLVVHVNAHTIVRNFACPQCPMVFALRVDLEDHRGMHAEYGHKCELCGAGFGSQRALWTHKQVHTRRFASKKKKGSTSSNTIARNGYIKKSSFPCRVCGKVLSTKNTLREHMMIHSGEKPHECMLCGKLIRHKANFIIHVHSHSMRRQHHPLAHFCDLCETDFASKTELCQHQVEAHANRCEVCEMDFVSRGELHKHQMEEHSDSSHKCILCGDTFLSEEGLMEHVEGVHGDKKGEEYELFRPHMLEGL